MAKKKLVPDEQLAQYLLAESEHSAELQSWIDQQPEGIHQGLLGVLHWQLAQSVRENRPQLTKDISMAINAPTKSALQHQLLMGELWSRDQRREFENDLQDALMLVFQKYVPDEWEDAMSECADRFLEAHNRATKKAKIEAPKRITLK